MCASPELVVLDEAQAWPEVFPPLRGAIDARRQRPGRFLLLGSVSPALMTHVAESLAGRLALVELTPLLIGEVPRVAVGEHWLRGGYPDGGIRAAARFPRWQTDYLTLLAQREFPAWGLPAKPQVTERLLRMVAAAHGQVWNASRIGAGLGLSHPTVNAYLDFLVGAFLVRRLEPYAANVGKRLTRRPKVYWRDAGLLHALLRVRTYDDLLVQPRVGSSWEGYAIEQILSTLGARGEPYDAYFLRTSDDYEIDLLVEVGGERWACEVKLTSAPDPHDLARLNRVADLVAADRRILVSQTRRVAVADRQQSTNLPHFVAWLHQRTG